VWVRRRRCDWQRHGQHGIAAEVGEGHDALPVTSGGELLGEGRGARCGLQLRGVDQHELEGAPNRRLRDWRRLPAERGMRRVGKQPDEEGAERRLVLPAVQDLVEARYLVVSAQDKPATLAALTVLGDDVPHPGARYLPRARRTRSPMP